MLEHINDFESFNEELQEELRAKLQAERILANAMESLELSSYGANPEFDMPMLDGPAFVTDEDLMCADEFEVLGLKASNRILLRAAESLRMMEDMDDEAEPEQIASCGEWLQLNKTTIRNRMKRTLLALIRTDYDLDDLIQDESLSGLLTLDIYDPRNEGKLDNICWHSISLDDLIQEATLAVLTTWDNYDPQSGITQDSFCWHSIYNRMMTIRRSTRSQKRAYGVTESLNAVTLAHCNLEDIWLGGDVTWTSLVNKNQDHLEDFSVTKEDLNAALSAIQKDKLDVLSMLFEGYTQVEIASAIGCTQSQVSYMASTSRKNLKEAIA